MNIKWSGNEADRQELSILKNYFSHLEDLSQTRGYNDADAVSWVDIDNGLYLTAFMSGKDLFLGILDPTKWELNNSIDFEAIKETKNLSSTLIRQNVQQAKTPLPPRGLRQLWGYQIPKIRREESIIRGLPKGITVNHTEKPFVIELRKEKPFTDHDFVFVIDGSDRTCKTYIDGTYHPIDKVKTSHRHIYDTVNLLVDVCNGKDLSNTHINKLLKKNLDIDYER